MSYKNLTSSNNKPYQTINVHEVTIPALDYQVTYVDQTNTTVETTTNTGRIGIDGLPIVPAISPALNNNPPWTFDVKITNPIINQTTSVLITPYDLGNTNACLLSCHAFSIETGQVTLRIFNRTTLGTDSGSVAAPTLFVFSYLFLN